MRRQRRHSRFLALIWALVIVNSTTGVRYVQGQEHLEISLASINVSEEVKETPVLLFNTGTGLLSWTVEEETEWLWISDAQGDTRHHGILSGEGIAELTVHTAGLGLPTETYETTILIRSNGGQGEIPVRLKVRNELVLDASEERVDPADIPPGTWTDPIAIEAEAVMQVSMQEATSIVASQFVDAELNNFRVVAVTLDSLLYGLMDIQQGNSYGTRTFRLLRSGDRGQTWEEVLYKPPDWCDNNVYLHGLAIDPQNTHEVFLGTSDGLFHNGESLDLPPQAQDVIALALRTRAVVYTWRPGS